MLTALFITALAAQTQAPYVEVRGDEGFEFAGAIESGLTTLLLPQVTTNERAARLIAGPRGLRLQLACPAGSTLKLTSLRLMVVSHGEAEHLVLEGEAPILLSTPQLPSRARSSGAGASRLPELARCDLESVRGGSLEVSAARAAGEVLVLIGEEGVGGQVRVAERTYSLGSSPLEALILREEGPLELELEEGAGLDQLYWARELPLSESSRQSCELTRAWLFPRSSTAWRARQGRGPRRPTAITTTESVRPEALSDLALPLELAPGEVLELQLQAPRRAEPGQVQTFLLQLESEIVVESLAPPSSTPPPAMFVDRAREAGVWGVHFEGPDDQRDIRPTMGPGAAWGDVDGDGWQDLLLVQGGGREGCEPSPSRILRNTGNGFVEHATLEPSAGMGALFFDLEGDGDLDLYVANYGRDQLYENSSGGEFREVGRERGLVGERWSAGVCAGDTDGDGDLELYVTSYLNYDPALMPPVEELPGLRREDPVEMLPFAFPGERNTFYENEGGRFVDRTEERGLADVQGRGMQAVFWDFNLDGHLDLYIANDVSFNILLQGDGQGNFEDISFQTGMDDPRGGMGVAIGDVDGDRDDDLFLTNWQLEANALYLNNYIARPGRKVHIGTFQDGTVRSRLGPAGVGVTSWGAVLFDADNDGDLDLFIPNGYTSPDYESTGICVGQPNQFFLNDGEGRFTDVSSSAGPDVTCELASRAAAVCDYDRDGRLDLLVTNNNGPYQLLHNELESSGHWLGLTLRARGANPFAVGARVELQAGERFLSRTLTAGEGYLACHAPELHFGLGDDQTVEALTVFWPSGQTTRHEVGALDRWMTISEPE